MAALLRQETSRETASFRAVGSTAGKACVVCSTELISVFRLVYKGGHLYLFGGVVESGEKDITLKDFYSLDTSKFDSWNVIIENDSMEWLGNEEGEDDEDVSDEDESDMDTD